METSCVVQIFGIQIKYRPDWRVIPDHAYSLNYDSGLFRFEENVAEQRSHISFGLRWECSDTDNVSFLQEFSDNIEAEYRKAIKGKSRQFEILRNEEVHNPQGIPMRLIETRYKATQSLVNNPKKMQRLHSCNAAFYCERTHRMVAASLVTTPQYMEENREMLVDLLLSVQTQPIFPPEDESARMEKRAQMCQSGEQKGMFSKLFKCKTAI